MNSPQRLRDIDAPVLTLVGEWDRCPRRAVILDFNGTLSDDEPLLLRLYTEMFREHLNWTLTPEHYFGILAGLSDREIIEGVLSDRAFEGSSSLTALLAERRTRYCALVEERSPILPATIEMVELLRDKGVSLAIVTGAQRIDVEFVLARSPLADDFPIIVSEEDVSRGKPDPEGFRIALQALGISRAGALVFEDSLHGVAAAQAAGLRCIAVEGTTTRAELVGCADGVVGRLEPGIFAS